MEWFLRSQEAVYALYVGIAVGAFLLITGLSQLLSRNESDAEARNRRMKMIAKGATTAEIIALLKPDDSNGLIARLPFLGRLPRDMRQAGISMSPGRLLLLCSLAGAGLTMAAFQILPPFQAVLLGLSVALLGPLAVANAAKRKRLDKMTAQLPDALDLMARGLKVGHPLNTSISAVASDMPDPIGSEFGLIFDQVSYGDDLVTAFQDFADRVGLEDVQYLSASIAIQHGTGGDLARVVDILSKVIRGRIAMRQRIKAISAEGRLSAWFLSAIPLVIFGVTSVVSPDYYGGVSEDPLFMPMMIIIVVLVVANALIMRKLVNFRI